MIKDLTYEQYMEYVQNSTSSISKECPVCRTLELLNGKWKLILIYELSKKSSYRFGELRKAIPAITNTMLTTALRDLESMEIVNRVQFNEIPPHVEYSLTEKGKAFFPIFFEIARWGEKYL